jgi:CubicO group peptidase (beta-lactamase class C family)
MRILKWLAFLSAGGFGAILLLAPQLVVLWGEGFPSPLWPARGDFSVLSGADKTQSVSGAAPNETAIALFEASEGRVLLAERDGAIFAETFAIGLDAETRLNSYSLVKSLVGVLVVKAVADGKIEGLDTSLQHYLPEAPDVSIRSVLMMTSGLSLRGEPPKDEKLFPADDASFSPLSPVGRLHAFGIESLASGLVPDPELHGVFHYQSVNTALLGWLLESVYDQPLDEILTEKIWGPAGASTAYWRRNPSSGKVSAYCCVYASASDWLMVGRFLLDNGGAEPFLPEALWREWILPDLSEKERATGAYGWHLRHDILDREAASAQGPFAYFAGHSGQIVYLLPEQNAVVVRFGAKPQLLHSTLYTLFDQ